jgi:hypothetical protein
MVWILSILAIVTVLGLLVATAWGMREMFRSTEAIRLERRLNPSDVLELNQAFVRVQRDVLHGD